MNTASKAIGKLVVALALSATPLFAQIDNSVKFTTPFPFFVGNQSMPAGSYSITQPDMDAHLLLVQDASHAHSAYVLYLPTATLDPVNQGQVSFRQYGNLDFLASLTVTGDTTGLDVPPYKREKETAATEKNQASISVPLDATRSGE